MPEGENAEGASAQIADAKGVSKDKLSEYENDLKRLQAEFENYKKRAEKEKKEWLMQGKADAIREFLVLADEFDSAKLHSKNADAKALAKGMELLGAKLHSILSANKITEIQCGGQVDPHLHDVLLQQDGGEEGQIASVIRKGYKCGDIVLRHAQVAVYSGVKKEEEKKQSEEKPEEKSGEKNS